MDATEDAPPAPEKRLVIRVNSNAKMSRGKAAAHAVHAALKLYGIEYEHPVIVIGGKPDEILAQTVHIRDAGRTELEPGTLTAGASWEWRDHAEPDPAQ
ncbi:hypothetical protein ACRCUN_11740 [Mycobacterium sp. LTG2003]